MPKTDYEIVQKAKKAGERRLKKEQAAKRARVAAAKRTMTPGKRDIGAVEPSIEPGDVLAPLKLGAMAAIGLVRIVGGKLVKVIGKKVKALTKHELTQLYDTLVPPKKIGKYAQRQRDAQLKSLKENTGKSPDELIKLIEKEHPAAKKAYKAVRGSGPKPAKVKSKVQVKKEKKREYSREYAKKRREAAKKKKEEEAAVAAKEAASQGANRTKQQIDAYIKESNRGIATARKSLNRDEGYFRAEMLMDKYQKHYVSPGYSKEERAAAFKAYNEIKKMVDRKKKSIPQRGRQYRND